MEGSLKLNVDGKLCLKANGSLCLCPGGYTVVFPDADGSTWDRTGGRTFTLTESGGVYIATESFNIYSALSSPQDLAYGDPPIGWETAAIELDIEMTIDELTGERSVRTIITAAIVSALTNWAGSSDYTEVFADGTTFNLSTASGTVRYMPLSMV